MNKISTGDDNSQAIILQFIEIRIRKRMKHRYFCKSRYKKNRAGATACDQGKLLKPYCLQSKNNMN